MRKIKILVVDDEGDLLDEVETELDDSLRYINIGYSCRVDGQTSHTLDIGEAPMNEEDQ